MKSTENINAPMMVVINLMGKIKSTENSLN